MMQARDNWDTHWEHLNPVAARIPSQLFRHRLVAAQVRTIGPTRLLDIGCGQGDLLKVLSDFVSENQLAGIELSEKGVELSKCQVPLATIRCCDLTDPNYSPFSSSFDCLTCVEVLEHVDNPAQFLKAAVLHASAGAWIIVTVPSGPLTAFDISIGHRRHFDESYLSDVLRAAGLTDLQVRRVGFPFFNLYRFVVRIRGNRLIHDVQTFSLAKSSLSRFVLSTFSFLLRFNFRFLPFGYQLIATARKP